MKTITFTKEQGKVLIGVIDAFATVGKPQMRALDKAINAITAADDGFCNEAMAAELRNDGAALSALVDGQGKDTFAVSLEDVEHEVLMSVWSSCEKLPARLRSHVVGIDDAFEATASCVVTKISNKTEE